MRIYIFYIFFFFLQFFQIQSLNILYIYHYVYVRKRFKNNLIKISDEEVFQEF